jgi:hypothetical protein
MDKAMKTRFLVQNTASNSSPPENSIDDFISSSHIAAKQFNQEIKAAFASCNHT